TTGAAGAAERAATAATTPASITVFAAAPARRWAVALGAGALSRSTQVTAQDIRRLAPAVPKSNGPA
ncbi:hypothetical protein, partial [Candidatus Macondimonas diazotrophica]|uniref:hypothetical protein n=1 Tax=Candidatus Macondimonas diazotrophica TaxID=2305248 RepID=UPI001432480F